MGNWSRRKHGEVAPSPTKIRRTPSATEVVRRWTGVTHAYPGEAEVRPASTADTSVTFAPNQGCMFLTHAG